MKQYFKIALLGFVAAAILGIQASSVDLREALRSGNVDELKSKIIASGELFNSNKERVADLENPTTENFITILTRYRGNSVGTQKYQILTARAGISGLNSVKKGTLWRISAKNGNLKELWPKILATGVLFNQFSQDAYLLSSP